MKPWPYLPGNPKQERLSVANAPVVLEADKEDDPHSDIYYNAATIYPWAQDVYLSPGDAGRFFACAVEARTNIRFAIVYASSKPIHRVHFDLEPAKNLVGFVPQETWPQGIEVVEATARRRTCGLK